MSEVEHNNNGSSEAVESSPTQAPAPKRERRRRLRLPRFDLRQLLPWVFLNLDVHTPRGRRRLIAFLIGGLIATFVMGLVGFRAVEYMDTAEFCGELCHEVMSPQYWAYQNSPHARVHCVNCHIGPGADWMVKSKLSGVRQVFAVLGNTYSRPIPSPVHDLRPARETCEQCHWPQKFSEDRIRVYRHYQSDFRNSERSYTLVFRVGGGDIDGATGIHWHIASKVYYLPLDEKRQEIAWVRVERPDGSVQEYVDPERIEEVTPELIREGQRLMDCIDCHNRATHIFRSPEEMVDEALARGRIDRELPFIKRRAMEALAHLKNPGHARTEESILGLASYYRQNFPSVFAEKRAAISAAMEELQAIAERAVFPEMRVDWNTYANNLGHLDSPGCFRCHAKLVTRSAEGKDAVMDGSCNLCHYSVQTLPAPESGAAGME